jgi:hypothetical protein
MVKGACSWRLQACNVVSREPRVPRREKGVRGDMRVCTGGLQVLCKPLPRERLDDLNLAV